MSVLVDIQSKLACYADRLQWTRENGVVKATPKRKLSAEAHQIIKIIFERQGGKFVSNNGSHYFELMLKPRQLSPSTKIAKAYMELTKDGIFKEV